MNIKNKLKLALVFIIIMAASFIPGMFPEFFGDWVCKGGKMCRHITCGYDTPPTLHYGFRHWVFIIMGITFTAISINEIANDDNSK